MDIPTAGFESKPIETYFSLETTLGSKIPKKETERTTLEKVKLVSKSIAITCMVITGALLFGTLFNLTFVKMLDLSSDHYGLTPWPLEQPWNEAVAGVWGFSMPALLITAALIATIGLLAGGIYFYAENQTDLEKMSVRDEITNQMQDASLEKIYTLTKKHNISFQDISNYKLLGDQSPNKYNALQSLLPQVKKSLALKNSSDNFNRCSIQSLENSYNSFNSRKV